MNTFVLFFVSDKKIHTGPDEQDVDVECGEDGDGEGQEEEKDVSDSRAASRAFSQTKLEVKSFIFNFVCLTFLSVRKKLFDYYITSYLKPL